MNFPPIVKSWLILICIVVSTGSTAGFTAFLSGSSVAGAIIVGCGMAASNVLHSLLASPKELAAKMEKAAHAPDQFTKKLFK